jgi:alpha-glucosidase
MVQEWRQLIDEYNTKKGGDTRVLFTEAYASIDDTVRFYADSEGKPRAHFPFNFFLMGDLSASSTPKDFKKSIDKWMSRMPYGATPNWVVSFHVLSILSLPTLKYFSSARQSRSAAVWITLRQRTD